MGPRLPRKLAADDHFTEMVTREEKLQRGGVLEQFFDRPVVEILRALASSADPRNLQKRLLILNAVVVHRDAGGLLVRVEENEHRAARPHHAKQLCNRLLEQRRRQELERIPHQSAIEKLIRKFKSFIEKALRRARRLLALQEIVAKAFLHRPDNVI